MPAGLELATLVEEHQPRDGGTLFAPTGDCCWIYRIVRATQEVLRHGQV